MPVPPETKKGSWHNFLPFSPNPWIFQLLNFSWFFLIFFFFQLKKKKIQLNARCLKRPGNGWNFREKNSLQTRRKLYKAQYRSVVKLHKKRHSCAGLCNSFSSIFTLCLSLTLPVAWHPVMEWSNPTTLWLAEIDFRLSKSSSTSEKNYQTIIHI